MIKQAYTFVDGSLEICDRYNERSVMAGSDKKEMAKFFAEIDAGKLMGFYINLV